MSEQTKVHPRSQTIGKEIEDITYMMIDRYKGSNTTLSVLEKKLFDIILEDPRYNKDVNTLLKVCQYIKSSSNADVRAIWDFVLSIKQGKLPHYGDTGDLNLAQKLVGALTGEGKQQLLDVLEAK